MALLYVQKAPKLEIPDTQGGQQRKGACAPLALVVDAREHVEGVEGEEALLVPERVRCEDCKSSWAGFHAVCTRVRVCKGARCADVGMDRRSRRKPELHACMHWKMRQSPVGSSGSHLSKASEFRTYRPKPRATSGLAVWRF